MTTLFFESTATASDQGLAGTPARNSERYLIALDGGTRGDAAIEAAGALAAGTGAEVEVVSVIPEFASWTPDQVTGFRARRLTRIRNRMRKVHKRSERWPITLASGLRSDAIATTAAQRGATLIILGVTRLGHLERLVRGSTRLSLVARSNVPVLAVPTHWAGRPRRVVVATDFGHASIRGAELALDMMGRHGILYLTHVTRNNRIGSTHVRQMESRLAALADALPYAPNVTVEPVCLVGDPMKEIDAFTAAAYSDLLVVGMHGSGGMARKLWTTVPRRFLRRSSSAVLVVPEEPVRLPMS